MTSANKQFFEFPQDWAELSDGEKGTYAEELLEALEITADAPTPDHEPD